MIAFIRAAQLELVWIHEREELEVTRNWSDVQHLDIPMLQNYFKQVQIEQNRGKKRGQMKRTKLDLVVNWGEWEDWLQPIKNN